MKQALIKKGKVIIDDIPKAEINQNEVLIKVFASCISPGTELSSVKGSEKLLLRNLFNYSTIKKGVMNIRKSGIISTFKERKELIEEGIPLGYSVSGIVIKVGENIKKFKVGDKVTAGGAKYAFHSEFVAVPVNLVVSMPGDLTFDVASTTTIGSIALHAVRRSNLQFGEFAVVYGAGVLGMIIVQLLQATGVIPIVIDIDENKLERCQNFGVNYTINALKESCIEVVNNITAGFGADVVIVSAASNDENIISSAFRMCKRKGKVVFLGNVPLNISRDDIYEKELDLITSTSYGPGRYDSQYEEKGIDYPYAYARWTENRNMTEYLRLIDSGLIKVKELIDFEVELENVSNVYNKIKNNELKPLLVVIKYPEAENFDNQEKLVNSNFSIENKSEKFNLALIGISNFLKAVHLPILKKLENVKIGAIYNKTGFKSKNLAEQIDCKFITSDYQEILSAKEINVVFITTQHSNHSDLALRALAAGKHVFVEKPLAINTEQLKQIKDHYKENTTNPVLMVGFNRRFSPFAQQIKKHLVNRISPLIINYRMNAGFKEIKDWIFDQGGRIIGEACHIIDLFSYLTNSSIEDYSFQKINRGNHKYQLDDNVSMIIKYQDGSLCTLNYFAMGNNELSKEYMELHYDGKSVILDDYKSLEFYGIDDSPVTLKESNKGHSNELREFFLSINKGVHPIELESLLETTEVSINIAKNIREYNEY